jgi:transcriptional regulator with XRE-family HTH domain
LQEDYKLKEISTSNICNDTCNTALYFQPMNTIASRIADARKGLNLNQSELARMLSVTPQAVQSWESGKAHPKGARLQNLAKALGTSAEWLVMGKRPLFKKEMSEDITEEFAARLRAHVARSTSTDDEYKSTLRTVGDYLMASHALQEAKDSMRQTFLHHMKEGDWFNKIEGAEELVDIFFVTMGTAEGKLTPEDAATIHEVAERVRAIYEKSDPPVTGNAE